MTAGLNVLFALTVLTVSTGSIVAAGLSWRARRPLSATLQNLNSRVISWWFMIAVGAVTIWSGVPAILALFFGLSLGGIYELLAAQQKTSNTRMILIAAASLLTCLQFFAVQQGWISVSLLLLPVVSLAIFLSSRFVECRNPAIAQNLQSLATGLLFPAYGLSFVPAIATMGPGGGLQSSLFLISFLVVIVQGSDVLQYVFGNIIGRFPVLPQISPSKTWEGLIGGVGVATIVGALLAPIAPFGIFAMTSLTLLVCAAGFGGGVLSSALKRKNHIKDWGSLLPGHGGILDRVDSLVLAAPALFGALTLIGM